MAAKRYAILGLGHFGFNLALQLTERGVEVLAIDTREERVEMLRDRVAHAMVLDSTDRRALGNLGLQEFDGVVVAIGEDFEASIMTCAHLQEMGIKRIIGRVMSPVHERVIRLMKIDEVILPEADAAAQTARRLTFRNALEAFDITRDYSVIELAVPSSWIGQTVGRVGLRGNYSIKLVTIIRRDARQASLVAGQRAATRVLGVPSADTVFEAEDILVIFGEESNLQRVCSL